MRISGKKESIDYKHTSSFFDRRAKKYNDNNPYGVTMYQDNNPKLVEDRNRYEVEKLLPKLSINYESTILDVACGIGRWSDAITVPIKEYFGIDFCKGLIQIANERNVNQNNRRFVVGSSTDVENVVRHVSDLDYNVVLMIGALVYLNDEDILATFKQVERLCANNATICIREPIGLCERLTLKEQFSDELNDEYNAIYRTRDELIRYMKPAFIDKGFCLEDEDFLFDSNLNNRKETAQYYFILRRY